MLNKKTVFILGAGASKPYGFPTTFELSEQIIYGAFDIVKSIFRRQNESDMWIKENRFKDYEIGFLNVFKKAYSSNPISVDDFLSRENNLTFYGSYGLKLVIHYLLMLEDENRIRIKDDWIELLTKKISKGISFLVKEEENEIDKNFSKIKIITFNYERSFEYFLYKSLIGNGYTENQVESFLRLFNKNILHIYGAMGKILNTVFEKTIEEGFWNYGALPDEDELYRMKNNIKIIYDERKEYEKIIKEFFKDVEQIFFLGFGYDEFNIDNLFLTSIENPDIKIYGTIKGRVHHFDKIKKSIIEQNNKLTNLVLEDVDCNNLIDRYL